MKTYHGDIWNLHPEHFVVVPTNLGWDHAGLNVMGAGLAKQAADRFPDLRRRYGGLCRDGEKGLIVFYDLKLIMFPTKGLNEQQPWLSWRSLSDLSLVALARVAARPIAVPLVGCGHGGLPVTKVTELLAAHLKTDKFIEI